MIGLKNVLRNVFLAGSVCLFCTSTYAQYECRSRLSGNLHSIKGNETVRLGGEVIVSGGFLESSPIGNAMAFGAMEVNAKTHQLYAEGGIKYWHKQDNELKKTFSAHRFGMRSLSYTYFIPQLSIKAGLQQFKSSDLYLINERAVGVDLKAKIKNTSLNIATASVVKDFSRNGYFCANAFLYDIVPTRNIEIGDYFLETNFLSVVYSIPIDKKTETTPSDEFKAFDEFSNFESSSEQAQAVDIKNVGIILHSEFGQLYDNTAIIAGANTEIEILTANKIQLQLQYQSETNNNAIQAFVKAEHEKSWNNNTATSIQLHYLDQLPVSENAMSLPRFSNLFFGEILRMDAIDLPIGNVVLKHRWIEHHSSIKLMYTHQFGKQNMQEANISAGKLFFHKKLRVTGIGGIVESNKLESWTPAGKIEIRYFF